jgi:short-subunit dehydrogenase
MNPPPRRWALVTGASSGLGVAFARALAAQNTNLVLAARREAEMQALATDLRHSHGVEIVVESIDLSVSDSAADLAARLDQRGIAPDILINNAAFGLSADFVDHDADRLRAMLQLDIVTFTELTHLYAKRMAAAGRGHILLVASLAAYQPCPHLAAYAAAKAYVLSLGEALHVELAPKVGVTVLCPGLMDTGFLAVADFKPTPAMRRSMTTPAHAVDVGLAALFAGKATAMPGGINKVMAFGTRFLSRQFTAKMAYRMSKG